MVMNNKVYDVLKWIIVLVLPALAGFVTTFTAIWGIPYGNEISLSISAVEVLLGAIFMISSVQYKKKAE